MKFQFKDIHIGDMIFQAVQEQGIEEVRIENFLKASNDEIEQMYRSKSLDTEVLLRWSKLLEYDFFRIYSQHLLLYAPFGTAKKGVVQNKISRLPQFRKNIYTTEIIDFILELIDKGEKTKSEVISEYKIPKTTLYKWIKKHKQRNDT